MIQDVVECLDCVGCGACIAVCHKHAINFTENKEGFYYPIVDKCLCVECGLCRKVCPALNSGIVKHQKGIAYAAVNQDVNIRLNSSSGGIFSAIAEYVINKGGVVFGAAFDERMILCHRGVDNIEELSLLRGSKYLQSNISPVFVQIKDLLKKRLVYFVGTSCQVSALKLYIGKNQTDNLLTSDIVCHGVPSQKVFNVFIKAFEQKKGGKIVSYNFRDKSVNGWNCCSSSSSIKKNRRKHKYRYDRILNAYFAAFISGSINRECCYKCKYTTEERVSDVTLADFWGVNKYHKDFHCDYGVSLVIVNTEKGRKILSDIGSKIKLVRSEYKYAEEINKCLYESTPRPVLRNSIYECIDDNPNKIIDVFIVKGFDVGYVKYLIKKFLRTNPNLYAWLYDKKKQLKL